MNKTDILKLFDSRHHIKAEVLKDTFKKTSIYRQILLETKNYNIFNNLSLHDRLLILRYNIKIKYCNTCNSPYINIDKKHIKTCLCFKKDKISKINCKKDYHLNDINDLIYFINKNKNFNIDNIIKRYQHLITYVINQTKQILPFNSIADLNLSQRLYHIFYNMHELPRCNKCLNKLVFKNFDSGYTSCKCNVNSITLPSNSDISTYLNNTSYTWLNKNIFNNLHDMPIKLQCNKCKNKFNYTFTEFKYNNELDINCNICNPIEKITQQKRISNFINDLSFQTIENYNPELGKVGSYECDIFIPALNIGIEYNGLHWHSTNKLKTKDYHLNKLEYYNKFNIRLITIFEDEWLEHEQLIKEKLRVILNKSANKIYAKTCIVKPISTALKNKFIKTYTFNTIDKSKIKLGIFNNNYIIGIMTFDILNNNNWQLINYITNTHIIGRRRKVT